MPLQLVSAMQGIRKAGVGISGDAQKLMRDFGLQCEGLVDLSEEANLRLCHPASGRAPEKWSLASERFSTDSLLWRFLTLTFGLQPEAYVCAAPLKVRHMHSC